MSVRGWVQGCECRPRGSELTAYVAAGATVLTVEDTTDFDDAAGTIQLNDQVYTYSEGAVDDDAGTITLDAGLAVAALESDWVFTVAGGQVLQDSILAVSCGDGDDVEVTVPFGQRDYWPEGDYDEPVMVELSDDLERIVEVPGRRQVTTDAEITGSTITGGIFRTDSSSGTRLEIGDGAIAAYAGSTFVGSITPNGSWLAFQGPGTADLAIYPDRSQFDGHLTVVGDILTGFGNVSGAQLWMTNPPTTTSSANVFVGDAGQLRTVTGSSRRFKDNIEDLNLDLNLVRQIRPRRFTYADWYYDDPTEVMWGLIGEELDELGLDKFVDHDDSGAVINVRYAYLSVAAIALAQDCADRIDALEEQSEAQQAQIDALTARLEALEARS